MKIIEKHRYQTKPITDIFKNPTEYKNFEELIKAMTRGGIKCTIQKNM